MDGSNIIALLIRSSDLGPQLLAAFFQGLRTKREPTKDNAHHSDTKSSQDDEIVLG